MGVCSIARYRPVSNNVEPGHPRRDSEYTGSRLQYALGDDWLCDVLSAARPQRGIAVPAQRQRLSYLGARINETTKIPSRAD